MIKAQELRIGNKFKTSKIHTVLGINDNGIIISNQLYVSFKDAFPIELTPEILEKWCGFKREIKKYEQYQVKYSYEYYYDTKNCIRVSLIDDCCKRGLHWFQNWYYFETVEELIVNYEK